MKYRTVTIMPLESLGISGTKIIDVNIKDPISRLFFYFRYTTGAGERLAPEPSIFSKIELIDGSDVLMSLSGTEMVAAHFYEGYPMLGISASNLQSNTDWGEMFHDFGRFKYDPMLAFDPTKFSNPQFKITWNVATIEANATACYLEIVAECFDEKVITPIGFLQTREFYAYTNTASAYHYIDLPTDQIIRKLYFQPKAFGSATAQLMAEAKLSEDNDKRIPFDLTYIDWANMNAMDFGVLGQNLWADLGQTDYVFGAPCWFETPVVLNTTGIYAIQGHTMSNGLYTFLGATASNVIEGILYGSLPYAVYCYPFGLQQDVDDWYDPTGGRVGSLRLRILSGTVGSKPFAAILQQLRRY
jgi:hypothetical protein